MVGDDDRRKRALYRARHRGSKEMDWILGRFAEAELGAFSAAQMERFDTLLTRPDPDIDRWIKGDEPPEDIRDMVVRIRRFHGLED